MFERFTDQARRVAALAQDEARMLQHDNIGTEHILLGLIREGEGVAAKALESHGVALEGVRVQVEELIGPGQGSRPGNIPFTSSAKNVLELSLRESLHLGHDYIGTEHILLGLIHERESLAAQVLVKLSGDLDQVRQQVLRLLSDYQTKETASAQRGRPISLALDQFGWNLTHSAREGKLDPVLGREREIEQVMRVLSRRTRTYPMLIGEPGIDKSSIVEGLALAITHHDVPPSIASAEILSLAVRPIEINIEDTEDFLSRLQKAFDQTREQDDVILFIDDLPTLLSMKNLDFLRTFIAQDGVRVIGGGTPEEYDARIARDGLLQRLFQPIEVAEPSVAHTIEILRGVRYRYELHHRVTITDEAIIAAAVLAEKYVSDRLLPDAAVNLMDEAGARTSVRRLYMPPPELRVFDDELGRVRRQKESAIDERDFEKAAALRESEKEALARRARMEKEWRNGTLEVFLDVDAEAVVETIAYQTGLSPDTLRGELPGAVAPVAPSDISAETNQSYVLLNDQPVRNLADDVLGTTKIAEGISSIVSFSRRSAPFVMAVDGGWGVGKSTLLTQIEERLPPRPDVITVKFNAWTAHGENSLEGLIKSVLVELDRNIVRRAARNLAKRRRVVGVARLSFGIVARLLGVTKIVDEMWTRLNVDSQSRNELRVAIQEMLHDWTMQDGNPSSKRTLVVLIDDLDRCSDDVVVGVCEAVKLYLDAPGMIFIIACDMSVLARGVASAARGGAGEGRTYLEKIVQVAYRVPTPGPEAVDNLIKGFGRASGVSHLLDARLRLILADGTNRNPRRIKRIINSFIVENHLNPAWQVPPLGTSLLLTTILVQHLYSSFYDFMLREGSGDDPIGDFLGYADVRARASDPPPSGDPWWASCRRLFRSYGVPAPERGITSGTEMASQLENLERSLPAEFPTLARNESFLTLLRGVGPRGTRDALYAQLVSSPLGTDALPKHPPPSNDDSAIQHEIEPAQLNENPRDHGGT